jgi:hypothetical protein
VIFHDFLVIDLAVRQQWGLRYIERNVPISSITLTCLLHLKAYGTYRAGTAFPRAPEMHSNVEICGQCTSQLSVSLDDLDPCSFNEMLRRGRLI